MKCVYTMLAGCWLCLIGNFIVAQPTLQWQKNLGGSGTDKAVSIKPTQDGGFIVAGESNSTDGNVSGNHGKTDYWVTKLDAQGNITWQKSYGGSGDDIATCIQQTSTGGYIVAGTSNSIDGDVSGHGLSYHVSQVNGQNEIKYLYPPPTEAWIVLLDNTGNITSNYCLHYTYEAHDYFNYLNTSVNTIIQTIDNNYLYGGIAPEQTGIEMFGYYGMWGTNASYSTYYKTGDITAILETADGYIATGNCTGQRDGSKDIYVRTFDKNFVETGFYQYGGSNEEKAADIQAINDNEFIVGGSTASSDYDLLNSGSRGEDDYWLFRIKKTGEIIWSKAFGGTGNDIARSVQQLADGSFLMAGSSASNDGLVTDHNTTQPVNTDYWIIKVDGTGNFTWGKSFGGSGNDDAYALQKTGDGFIVAGGSLSADAGFLSKGLSDYWLLKATLSPCGVIPLPVAYNQMFCSNTNPQVSSLKATGINLKWYLSGTGGSPLSPSTELQSGNYYVSQNISANCESERKCIAVTLSPAPAPPVAALLQTFCKNKSPKIPELSASGTALKWYNTYSGGTVLSPALPLVTGFYFVSQTSAEGCESARSLVIAIVGVGHCGNDKRNNENIKDHLTNKIDIYPNPASNTATVEIRGIHSNTLLMQVIDMNGRILIQQNAVITKAKFVKTIDISRLPQGIYVLRYIAGAESDLIKFEVAR